MTKKKTNTQQKKFCVIKCEDCIEEFYDGVKGWDYYIAAKWSFNNGHVSFIEDHTPFWLTKILERESPTCMEEVESCFWIPDKDIAALKTKCAVYLEEGVDLVSNRFNEEQDEDDNGEDEYTQTRNKNKQILDSFGSNSTVLIRFLHTCMGDSFSVGTFISYRYDSKEESYYVKLKDPTEVVYESVDPVSTQYRKITNKVGEIEYELSAITDITWDIRKIPTPSIPIPKFAEQNFVRYNKPNVISL